MSSDPLRFLGLTKVQALGVVVAIVVVLVATQVLLIGRLIQIAEEGAQSHSALCVYKSKTIRDELQTQAYLDSDTNGTIFGFPRSLFVKSLQDQKRTVSSLSGLKC